MDQATVDGIWEDLHAVVGDSLRGVTVYRGIDQVSALREDIREAYSEGISQKMADENVVDWYSEIRLQESIQAGTLGALVRFYPEFLLIAWAPDGKHDRGVLAAYDRPAGAEGKLHLFEVVEYLNGLDEDVFE